MPYHVSQSTTTSPLTDSQHADPPAVTNPVRKPRTAKKPQIIFTAYDVATETGQQDSPEDDPYKRLSDAYALEDGHQSIPDQNVAFQGEYDGIASVTVHKKPPILKPKPYISENRLKKVDEDVYEYPMQL